MDETSPRTGAEHQRLSEITDDVTGWRRWGPYVSDRSWATVREDYSSDGNAWSFLSHDMARSRAYRWGEDGIAGICDRYQLLVFAPAFWNHNDDILKERLFGLVPDEGNHGEDVKEYYFHLDSTPTHSYMRFLYKYPQAKFPYAELVQNNRRRSSRDFEYELLDTGVFDDERYFDIFIEYAKISPEDMAIRIEAFNRGPDPAPLDLLAQLWFRNTWSWGSEPGPEPVVRPGSSAPGFVSLAADDSALSPLTNITLSYRLGGRTLYGPTGGKLLFTDNESNLGNVEAPSTRRRRLYTKDAFHRAIVNREPAAVNPERFGTKAVLHYGFESVPAGQSVALRLRLSDRGDLPSPLAEIDDAVARRRREADEFYETIHPPRLSEDEKRIQRQALAGLLWSKQSYLFDVNKWLEADRPDARPARSISRNVHWRHLNSMRVMTLPDKWEYPWFAAWDLAFQCVALALVDPQFAKDQLWVLLFEQFQHPNGQIPAYEWEFSDLNPPVHAWAVWRVYNMDLARNGRADRGFLERCFHKLLINFAWWVNKVDRYGNNVFEGGFLGLDNITLLDRSEPWQDGSVLEQADATGWMGMFCLNMMRIALELAQENRVYEGMATKFFQHYTYIGSAMKRMGGRDYQLWDSDDGFFYDVLRRPDGRFTKFRVRSMVGLIPLFAVERLEVERIKPFKEFTSSLHWFLKNRRDLVEGVVHPIPEQGDVAQYALTIVDGSQLRRMVERIWDPAEFLSDYGIRSLSKAHAERPFLMDERAVRYEPAESVEKIKGGNSNWRGPIWFPTCFLLIESFRKLGAAFGPSFAVATAGSGDRPITFADMARQMAERLIRIFAREGDRRAVYGGTRKFQDDPHWKDYLLFYEYFHGDNGAGLGASHQTGWTALVASLIDEWRRPLDR
jgi:hypothetical protein